MRKISFFIDGFNVYHAIDARRNFNRYKWLDYKSLASGFLTKKDVVQDVFYFTALATWSQDKVSLHKSYIRALELQGVKTVYGEFKRKDKFCPLCRRKYRSFEEKMTDVNIALYLLQEAIRDSYDTAIIISGDSDLIPSIKAVQKTFPDKKIGVVIPIGRSSESLKQVCDFHIKMKEMHLSSSLLPKEIDLGHGKKIVCPQKWC